MGANSNDKQTILLVELDRLYAYWEHGDDRLHSTLSLFAGVATILVTASGVRFFTNTDASRWSVLGVLFLLLGMLAAAAGVIQAGNQAGKLVTILAMEQIRHRMIASDEAMFQLPTFGRLHIRIENLDDVEAVLAGTRNDYRPITVTVAAGASLLVAAGIAIVFSSGPSSPTAPLLVVAVLIGGGMFVATIIAAGLAARVLARRMANGFDRRI